MALEATRQDSEAAYEKEQNFQAAKADVEWYQRKMADLRERLEDFSAFEGGMEGEGVLPVCMPDMYLDEKNIPQSMAGTAAMDGMAGMDGFNGTGTGMQGMTDGGMGAMNMGQYGAQGSMTAAGMNGNMNMNMGDGSMTGNMNMNGMTMDGDMSMGMGNMGTNTGTMGGMDMSTMGGMANMGDMANMGGMANMGDMTNMGGMANMGDMTNMGGMANMGDTTTGGNRQTGTGNGSGNGQDMQMPEIKSLEDLQKMWDTMDATGKEAIGSTLPKGADGSVDWAQLENPDML